MIIMHRNFSETVFIDMAEKLPCFHIRKNFFPILLLLFTPTGIVLI